MALISKPDVNIIWAEGGNQLEPASEVQELGFVVEKPPYEVVNWLHNKHDTAVAYLYQEGFADWDIETEYSNNSYIKYDGSIYKAKLQNIGKQPDVELGNWEVAFANYQDFLDLYQDLQDTKNVAGHGGNLVYKDNPVMSAKAVGTSYSANIGFGTDDGYQFNEHSRDGLFHNGTNPVVLNDGTTVAQFSGDINTPADKDVVTFDMLKKYVNPVGSLYFTINNVSPNVELGFGTWERYAEGRAIIGYSSDATSASPDWVKQGGSTFGSYEHTLSNEEMPTHDHLLRVQKDGGSLIWPIDIDSEVRGDFSLDPYGRGKIMETSGGSRPHNNVQPSIVVFIWRRVS